MCPTGTSLRRGDSSNTSPDFRQAFDVLDKDQDGKISATDLQTFYTGFSKTPSREDIGSMIAVADLNKNGVVEYEEFEKVLGCNGSCEKVMEDMFKVMDRDGDGKVGYEDLKSYLSFAGFGASDEDVRAMIELGSGDEKNGVGFEGLMKILAIDSM